MTYPIVALSMTLWARKVVEGKGAQALRILGEGVHHDPFVLFDDYVVPPDASFPMHPHNGFEGFQYLFEGSTLFEDLKGNSGSIGPGGARRFVCTGGFNHSERPLDGLAARGALLWVKLPSEKRDSAQLYQQASSGELPLREEGGMRIRTVVGSGSVLGSVIPVSMEVVEGAGQLRYGLDECENGLIYVRTGEVIVEGQTINSGEGLAIFGPVDMAISARGPAVMVVVKGSRIGEPIVQEGGDVL
jgi:hypothetical protein